MLAAYASEASRAQAQEIIRGLIERIVLTPVDGVLRVEMTGDLAAMLTISQAGGRKNTPGADVSGVRQVKVVAGTGFGRCRTRFHLNKTRAITSTADRT